MLRKLLQLNKASIVNEIMQLYRFVVDKYAERAVAMPNGDLLESHLIFLMQDIYQHTNCFKSVVNDDEGIILVMTMLRVATQIVVRS